MSRKRSRVPTSPAAVNTNVADLLGKWKIRIDPDLLVTAVTHRSFAFETGGIQHNERLEFLGDSVLSIIVTEYLFRKYPTATEAQLSRMRGALVSQQTLAEVARRMDLGDFILLGKGENLTGGRERDSILCDTFEAMIGATYISHGLEPTRSIVESHLRPFLRNAVSLGKSSDYKTTLQEYCSEAGLGEPVYESESTGPDHERIFSATVSVGGVVVGSGTATSKKQAKSEAAKMGYFAIAHPEEESEADLEAELMATDSTAEDSKAEAAKDHDHGEQ